MATQTRVPVIYNSGYNIQIFGADLFTMFDLQRYRRVYDYLRKADVVDNDTVIIPRMVTDEELSLVHTDEWIKRTGDKKQVAKVFGINAITWFSQGYVQKNIVNPFRMQTRGTVLAARYALKCGVACNLGGGFAHACREGGSGFNLFADVPLAVATLRRDGWKGKVFILDVDIHHGQGNAKFFRDDPSVFIMDIYNNSNYPYTFEKVDLPVAIPPGTGDREYLKRLAMSLTGALDRFKPELLIYIAGVDSHSSDRIGGTSMTEEGIFLRDKYVINTCRDRKIPLCLIMSGGYWDDCWRSSGKMFRHAAEN